MRFGVLGPVSAETDGGLPVRVPEAKVRLLLAALLARAGEPVSTDRLVEDIWGDGPPGDPVNALQTKVSQLRRALELAEPGGRALVGLGPAGYRLAAEPDDARRFAGLLAEAASSGPAGRVRLLTEALSLWRGPAYADAADAEFARGPALRLAEARLCAVEDLALARLDLDQDPGDLAAMVAEHPLRERLRAAHLRALYRAGRQGEALDSYADLRARLAEELGADPGPEIAAVHRAILTHDPALTGTPPPRPALPAPVGELIGRDGDVLAVLAALATDRLVTLTGPGGVGKTRLALAVAHEEPADAWLVELAAVRASPAEAVAAALGVRDEGARAGDPVQQLVVALRGRELLLVLDNCEHVVAEAAALAAALLRGVPGLRVLATSREPLAISGERVRAVAPLSIPDDAVRLFLARSGIEPHEDNAAAVTAICRALDGIPLALELAAARARAFGVHGLARRLGDRFRVLDGGPRDAPARQRTLRATIDWSWELLSELERAVLRRLAWHADGCDADGAAAVTGLPADEALDVIARLADRSLVVVADDRDGTRYRLLETVTAYGLEQSRAAGDADATRTRYVAHYAAVATSAALCGPAQREWLLRLEAEAANLDRAVELADDDTALRIVEALAWSWFLRGRHRGAHRRLSEALARPGGSPARRARVGAWLAGFAVLVEAARDVDAALAACADPGDRGFAALFLAAAHLDLGDATTAESLLVQVGDLADLDDWSAALLLVSRATAALIRSDLAEAERAAARALAQFTALGDGWGRLQAVEALAALAQITGDYPRAARLHRDALATAEDLRLWNSVAHHLAGLGRVAMLTGDFACAKALHERSLAVATAQSDTFGAEFAEVGLGMVARRTGAHAEAEEHLLRWLDWNAAIGSDYGLALLQTELGFVAEQRGDAGAALARHRSGLESARRTGDPRAVAFALEGMAGAHAAAGASAHAARLLGAASGLRERLGARLPDGERSDVDRIEATLRSALGPRFDVEHATGHADDALRPGIESVSELESTS